MIRPFQPSGRVLVRLQDGMLRRLPTAQYKRSELIQLLDDRQTNLVIPCVAIQIKEWRLMVRLWATEEDWSQILKCFSYDVCMNLMLTFQTLGMWKDHLRLCAHITQNFSFPSH
jgi:hypothetical protein